MTTSPKTALSPQADGAGALRLSDLVNRVLTDRRSDPVGRLRDVIAQLRGTEYPLITGLVAVIAGRRVFVPAGHLTALDGKVLRLGSAQLILAGVDTRRRPWRALRLFATRPAPDADGSASGEHGFRDWSVFGPLTGTPEPGGIR